MWCLDQFEYRVFDSDVHLSFLDRGANILYLDLFGCFEFDGEFTFSVLEWKFRFWANLVQKSKMVCLNWNFVGSLIQMENWMVEFTFSVFY